MTKHDFLVTLQDMLQCENALQEQTVLTGLEEWDSLAFMVLIAFFDNKFGQRLTFDNLKSCSNVSDLITLANGAIV